MRKIIIAASLLLAVNLLCLFTSAASAEAPDGKPLTEVQAGKMSAEAQAGKLYGIGSVSKVFTAAAVMKLVDDGKLDLDTPLTDYIPEFTMADERYREMTPRMLLNHSSGLMGMTDNNAFLIGDNDTWNHDHFLELLQTQTLKHDPGDRSIYSNDSFTLAEILVERVSGTTFTDFIELNFSAPLGLANIKTPQSDFDRSLLAGTWLGNNEAKPQNLGVIGSGGIYATMEDLCGFARIFMDSSDGSVLSGQSVDEMAKNQHAMEMVDPGADTAFRYGLGWDCVEQYPFNRLGIRALSKGGATGVYYTNLTVLPEYNLAAAVASSGDGGMEALVAQEIIMAVLEEEGLIPQGTAFTLPIPNLNPARIPEDLKSCAGLYDSGIMGLFSAAFEGDSLIMTPIGVRNERPTTFLYNTDGEFVSADDDRFGMFKMMSGSSNPLCVTTLRFEGKYLVMQTYEEMPNLGLIAEAMPLAEKIEAVNLSGAAQGAWAARNEKEYLLVSEKFTSAGYITGAIAMTLTDERAPGYVIHGIYKSSGKTFPATRILDENTSRGYQNTPTNAGRDIVNLSVTKQNGAEYLNINNYRYIDAAEAVAFSKLGEVVTIGSEAEPVWVDVDSGLGGNSVSIQTPANGSWFVYDDRMNCIAASLEKNLRETIILPENGRLAFAGEAGAVFTLQ
jgi:CubicO group peptidase (beta-lactamase class C family)